MIRKAANIMEFQTAGNTATGYIAIPERGEGPGVLVLHAWWGLNDFFKNLCERLAREGFVAVAPDLYDGATASTIDEAKQLLSTLNFEQAKTKVISTAEYIRDHPAVRGKGIGAIGFSMGGAWALLLSSLMPEDIAAVVVFYGSEAADFAAARAAYLGHFAENDEWEPLEGIRQMEADLRAAGRKVTFYTYSHAGHWFFESNRPENYDPEGAALAWQRTCDFLRESLSPPG
jgi:carboxymethylenebutenolidase